MMLRLGLIRRINYCSVPAADHTVLHRSVAELVDFKADIADAQQIRLREAAQKYATSFAIVSAADLVQPVKR
jgi:bacillopeptidase F (M6 metalloprotease family)